MADGSGGVSGRSRFGRAQSLALLNKVTVYLGPSATYQKRRGK